MPYCVVVISISFQNETLCLVLLILENTKVPLDLYQFGKRSLNKKGAGYLKHQPNGSTGSDADGDSVFRQRQMLKDNQYSKDCRTYESITNIYYTHHLESSPYKLIDMWVV